jgi:endonuclease/exonuclease/phosphatase family metal-dependent hydrolase
MKRVVGLFLLILLSLPWACAQRKVYTDPEGPIYSGRFCEASPEFTGTIKVVSYNIKLGNEIKQAIEELAQVPELCGADIILLQEMDSEGTAEIAEELGYDYVYFPAAIHAKHGREYGNAVLTRWPITDRWKLVLPHHDPVRKNQRIAAVATIEIGEFEVLTYSVHIEMVWLEFQKRIAQVDSVIRSVGDAYEHVIVGGDFNTESGHYVQVVDDHFEGAGFTRATEGVGPTVKADPFGLVSLRFDHIFTKGMTVVDKGHVTYAQASDHLPIWVELKLE